MTERKGGCDEIERLKADIERHVKLAADQQQEIERLRAINRRAKQLADEHAKEVVRLLDERDRLIKPPSLKG